MAVKWNKIYRGGIHRTTPETREVNYAGAVSTILPGGVAVLDATNGIKGQPDAGEFWYLIGEQLHGSVDDNQVATPPSTLRLYTPRSGDLYAGRAAAGIAIVDDLPLTINDQGQFAAAGEGDVVHAYVDDPTNAYTRTPTPTVANQLIPIKIK